MKKRSHLLINSILALTLSALGFQSCNRDTEEGLFIPGKPFGGDTIVHLMYGVPPAEYKKIDTPIKEENIAPSPESDTTEEK